MENGKSIHDTDVTAWALPEGAIARLGRGVIRDITISSEKRIFAVATHIGTWIYELNKKQPIALLDTERGLVSTVALSNDGKWIATNNWDGIINVHETETFQCVTKIQGWYKGTSRLAFSPDNQYIAAAGNGYGDIYVWHTQSGKHVASFRLEGRIEWGRRRGEEKFPARYPICFSPDGQMLAYASDKFTITVRHLKSKKRIASLPTTLHLSCSCYVFSLVFLPCNQHLAASIQDLETQKNIDVQVWNINKEVLETTYTDLYQGKVLPAYTPESTLQVADFYRNKVVMVDATQGEELDSIEYQTSINAVNVSSDAQLWVIITSREINVWQADSSITDIPIQEPTSPTDSMFFSQSDNMLICKYWGESSIVFWGIKQKQVMPPPISVNSTGKRIAHSPCEELLAIIGENRQTIEVWSITSETQIAELSDHKSSVSSLMFSPSGEHLISGDTDGNLVVWCVQRWEKQNAFIAHTKVVKAIAIHPNCQKYATVAWNGHIHLWDIASGEQLGSPSVDFTLSDKSLYRGDEREIHRSFNQSSKTEWVNSITFSPCGTYLVGGLYGEIRLWDSVTLEPHMGWILPESCWRVGPVVFSPCGKYLASGTWWNRTDKVSIRIWDVATGENIHTFWGHPSDIQNLAFSKDGNLLASSSYEGTILLWDMKPYINT